MGKQRARRKASKRRLNPLQRKGVQAGLNEANTNLLTTEQLTPVIQRLSSDNGGERAWAAACISNLILSNASTRKLLLTKGIVPILIERLSDPQQEVRDESLGALRNLASVDDTIAKEYYSRNILTPLSALLPQITQTIDSVLRKAPIQDELDQERRKSIWDVTENFIYIIWCICEASDKYVKAINRMNLIPFLTSFLISGDSCPTRVILAAGQCLNTLTDDNKDLYIEFQHHSEYIQSLLNIVRNEDYNNVFIQVLTCAVLVNIRDVVRFTSSWDDDTDVVAELNQLIIPILIKALDYDIQQAAIDMMTAMKNSHNQPQKEENDITPKRLTNEEMYIQDVENRLSIIQLALELLADICVQDDDSEEDGYQDESMMTEEQEEEHDEVDETIFTDKSKMNDTLIRSNKIVQAYINHVFPHLIRLSTLTSMGYQNQSFTITQQRAFECLNNFLLAMNEVPSKFWFKEEHKSEAIQLWRWLFNCANQVAMNETEDKNRILEIIISCLWALGRGLMQDIPLEPTDVGSLCGTYDIIPIESMRVKIVGCLGPIAMRQGDIETNKVIDIIIQTIGIFIINLLSNKDCETSVMIEALNLIFDVYSDLAFDYDLPVFVHGGFLSILKQIVPFVRSKVKSIDRRKDFDLRIRGDEALDNLNAFIKYKRIENNKRK
ncbi:armadillo-type protein [Cokeromyces recurvatus]|uniref:armadillo-type protein n=1 Tax=Cokeromyces recurvatus TaxID=90255 RepID=UPI002220F4F4|nr:armadillo-type protein [Cokeromyces recurvatus]KAI7904918.1 armadillo-type protein [Cokeromyces recurvatus]